MITHIDIFDKIAQLQVDLPPVEEFWRLGDLSALRVDAKGRFYRSNYERGLLLYALVGRFRPRAVLEFGTGRGYGALCCAWAMEREGINGRVFTIDATPHDRPTEWAIDRGDGPRLETLSRAEVWASLDLIEHPERIVCLTGWSADVMKRWDGPPADLAFIDGGHTYMDVEHDFYAALNAAAPAFGVLFDDYSPRFGLKRFIDEKVAPHFAAEVVATDRRWPGGEFAGTPLPGHGMVWIHSGDMSAPLDEVYPPTMRAERLRACRRRQKWRRMAIAARAAGGPLWRLLPGPGKRRVRAWLGG